MAKHTSVFDFLGGLEQQNKTVAQWAKSKDLDLDTTYAVISGRVKGKRGHAREIVRAMGLPVPTMHTKPASRAA